MSDKDSKRKKGTVRRYRPPEGGWTPETRKAFGERMKAAKAAKKAQKNEAA